MATNALTETCAECAEEFSYEYSGGQKRKYCSPKCRNRVNYRKRYVPHDPLAGLVYIVTNPAWPGKFKIGKTGGLYYRFVTYQSGDPFRAYKIEATWKTSDRHTIEKEIHEIFKSCRVPGSSEWYELDLTLAITMLDSLPQMERCHDETVQRRPRPVGSSPAREVRDRNSNGA